MNEDTNAEFINGEVVMHSPVRVRHLFTVSQLVSVLNVHNVRNNLGFVGAGKGLICLTRNDFEPDICFFSKEKAAFKPDQMKLPAPDFIAEVLSPSTER